MVIGLLLVARWNELNGMVYANLGAVVETKAELALYRPDKPIVDVYSIMEIRRTDTLPIDSAQALYLTALANDPSNAVARRRLGLIALARRNFGEAVNYLAAAWQTDSNNRATRKGLGYALAWTGNVNRAQALLQPLPETRIELSDNL